jgi:heptosyltransferase-1
MSSATATLSTQSKSIPTLERILIVRLSAMGDIIHALPAVTALRNTYPDATIGWLIEERWSELLCTLRTPRSGPRSVERPLVDRVHAVDTKSWRSSPLSANTIGHILVGVSQLRAPRYEVAIDLQGAVRSAIMARLSKADVVYGEAQPRENAASIWYSRQVIVNGTHVIEQNMSMVEAVVRTYLDLPAVDFPRDQTAEAHIDQLLHSANASTFAILNPGAGWGAKQWPPERYGEVAMALATQGVMSFINFGPGEETLAHAAESSSRGTAKTVCCSIAELIALTRRASLFIGGDTGPMHLAAALRIPVVGIFGPTNPARNGPFRTPSIILRSPESVTTHRRHTQPDEGLLAIQPAQVVEAALELLENSRG